MAKTVEIIDDLEVMEVNEVDEMEQELNEATEVKTKKVKKEKGEKKAREPKIAPNQMGVSELASTLGTTGRELRMFLRKHFRDMSTEKGKIYIWERGSKELQDIIDSYKAAKAAPRKRAEKKAEAEATAEAVEVVTPIDLDDLDLEEDN